MVSPAASTVFAMPSRDTFTVRPVGAFAEAALNGVPGIVLDPFAGYTKLSYGGVPQVVTNDLNPETPCDYHLDAVVFLRNFKSESIDAVIFDPPYSLRQLAECYSGVGQSMGQRRSQHFFSDCKDEISRVVKPGGRVISFGWTGMGMGKSRGFTRERMLVVTHGGNHNATICVNELKDGGSP